MRLEGAALALIEDDPIMGESLQQRLLLEGASAVWWRTKTEAVRGLRASSIRVAICDIRLPDGTGEDVFRETPTASASPLFLFMTAFADIDQAVRLMKAGAGDYITKPFEMATLLSRIEMLLGAGSTVPKAALDLRSVRGEAERALIEQTLRETGGRVGVAAARLDVSRTTLWARMKVLGIDPRADVQKFEQRRR
jgi:DNA-binding NtrC family response regulator